MKPNDNIQSILDWFKQAKPNPTLANIATQIGCHYEKVQKMMNIMNDPSWQIRDIAWVYKEDYVNNKVANINKPELLDALCDQIVTALGVGYMMGFDMQGALTEVNRSNWSKFVDGKAILDENGKIAKPDTYSPPDLKPYVGDK